MIVDRHGEEPIQKPMKHLDRLPRILMTFIVCGLSIWNVVSWTAYQGLYGQFQNKWWLEWSATCNDGVSLIGCVDRSKIFIINMCGAIYDSRSWAGRWKSWLLNSSSKSMLQWTRSRPYLNSVRVRLITSRLDWSCFQENCLQNHVL
jgi:hypothetical protein